MRRPLMLLGVVAVAGLATWLGRRGLPDGLPGLRTSAPPALGCRWAAGQTFAFDVAIDTTLTFDETALAPGGGPQTGAPGRSETVGASGRLDARVVSIGPGGDAILATRLSSWTTDAPGTDAFPAVDADMQRPYLLHVDDRCHVVAAAREQTASVIAYRRVLAVIDRMDFVAPAAHADPAAPYRSRQLDDFGWYTMDNRWERGGGRGAIERRRVAYDRQPTTADALSADIRIRTAGGAVTLGDGRWFSSIEDREDVEVVANGRVPLRTRATSTFTAVPADAAAFADSQLALAGFTWGRPTDAELAAAHEALRGNALAGLSAPEAVARFLAVRDGGKPGAWQDSQRLLRDWMRGAPDGVRVLGRELAEGRYARKDQADFVLAMAKSGSPVARGELERLAGGDAASHDLRIQAASGCADLEQPTTETVAMLDRLASAPRTDTPDDILPSTALMSLGTIIDNAPGTAAAIQARGVLRRALRAGGPGKIEALYAASNAGDATFAGVAVDSTRSDVPEERAAGAHAMRRMPPSPAMQTALSTLLQEDMHPEVVKQVAEARREQLQTYGGALSEREVALFATKLPSAPEGVRWEILRTLGHVARVQPDAERVLVAWYADEPVDNLKMVIGQYVPASTLRP